MIPILFRPEADPEALLDANAIPLQDVNGVELLAAGDTSSARAFDTYGLGALVDCISCEVTEERNGEYELEMEYPMDGAHYDEIEVRGVIWAKPNSTDDPQAFRIYQITAPIDGVVTAYARHLSYDLSGIPVLPFTATSCSAACAGLISHAAVESPFVINTQVPTIADFKVDVPSSVRSWFGGKEGSLIDIYGGEWHYDNYTATLKQARGQDRGVVIRYGKNLIDFEQEKNCEEVWTGVLPYWYDEESGTVVKGSILNVVGNYDYRRILCLDLSLEFEGKPTRAQLKARAQAYINANDIGVPRVSIELDWAQSTEQVELCDTVTVVFERIGVSTKAKCVSTTWDVLKDRYSRIEIGDAKTNITDTIAGMQEEEEKQKTSVSATMLRAIQSATDLITGNKGGYLVFRDADGDGEPDELLVMDTKDIATATKVWRWNKNGLGYSSSGYNGPYALAMTAAGEIVADFITTGGMSADRITAGTMSANRISGGTIDATDVNITNLNASNINSGTINGNDVTITNLNASNITAGTLSGRAISGGSITGTTINNGSGKFKVDANGNVTANSLTSSSATITGGSININASSSSYQAVRLAYGSTSSGGVVRLLPGWVETIGNGTNYGAQIIGGLMYLGQISRNSEGNIGTMTAKISLNGNGGNITCVSLTQTSDRRLKEIFSTDVPDLSGVRAVRFRWREESRGKERIGYIAQDVEKIAPEMVNKDRNGIKSLDYIQVLTAKVERLERENDELRARLDRLEARFSSGAISLT